jgi:hypothetical protein
MIIAFGHLKGTGKDTIARYLAACVKTQRPGMTVIKTGFADLLKDVCYMLYGWAGLKPGYEYEDTEGRAKKEEVLPALGKSPRRIWIEVGNKIRDVYEDTWIDFVLKGVSADLLIISDLRYPNEAEKIKAQGGLVFKVTRGSQQYTSDVADDALLDYQGWTDGVLNDGTLEELYHKAVGLAEKYVWPSFSTASPTASSASASTC